MQRGSLGETKDTRVKAGEPRQAFTLGRSTAPSATPSLCRLYDRDTMLTWEEAGRRSRESLHYFGNLSTSKIIPK